MTTAFYGVSIVFLKRGDSVVRSLDGVPGRVPDVCTGKAGALHGLNKPGEAPSDEYSHRQLHTFSHNRKGARLASTPSLYVYAFSPPTCESQYVVGSVKNSPCLQRLRIASSLTLMPRPGPVGTGM